MLYFSKQNHLQDRTSKVSEAAGVRWRFYRRIIVGSWSNGLYIGGSNSRILRWNLELRISWQAQNLVSLKGDFSCSAHCKWRFICHADQPWDSFCVAGAIVGEVTRWMSCYLLCPAMGWNVMSLRCRTTPVLPCTTLNCSSTVVLE